jgi:hypothetical protein
MTVTERKPPAATPDVAMRPSVRAAIVQSSYIPWKGYFDLIRSVDEFVLLDDAQFTKRDWRNRNKIKTPDGPLWLSIPVVTKGRYTQAINETEIADPWVEKHWSALQSNYAKAPHFGDMAPRIRALYDAAIGETSLSRVNHLFLVGICEILGITTRIRWSTDCGSHGAKTDRLIAICDFLGAAHYLSGPSAANYLEVEKFTARGMTVAYADYSGYPEYPQLHPPFDHAVSILDLLFMVGKDAPRFMKPLPV